jgi:hypothetical protein
MEASVVVNTSHTLCVSFRAALAVAHPSASRIARTGAVCASFIMQARMRPRGVLFICTVTVGLVVAACRLSLTRAHAHPGAPRTPGRRPCRTGQPACRETGAPACACIRRRASFIVSVGDRHHARFCTTASRTLCPLSTALPFTCSACSPGRSARNRFCAKQGNSHARNNRRQVDGCTNAAALSLAGDSGAARSWPARTPI